MNQLVWRLIYVAIAFYLGGYLFLQEIEKDKVHCIGQLPCLRWNQACDFFHCHQGCLDRNAVCHPLPEEMTQLPFILIAFLSGLMVLAQLCFSR